jgi:hypothetical protein
MAKKRMDRPSITTSSMWIPRSVNMVQTRGLLPRRAAWQTAIFHSLRGNGLDIDGESDGRFPLPVTPE